MNKIITTLPIKPQSNMKTGLILSPLILDVLTSLIDCKSVLMLNLLHSFKDYTIHKQNFIDELESNELHFDKVDSDVNNIYKYKKIIKDLYDLNILKKEETINCKCECGKVDIKKDLLHEIFNKKMIELKDDEYICTSCLSPLHLIPTKSLVMECSKITECPINVFPRFIEEKAKRGLKTLEGSSFVITKNRDTGVSVNIDDDTYNIDIDFLLYLTPQLFDEEDIAMVCCNRHIIHTLLTNYINHIYGHKKLTFIEHPYIVSSKADDSYSNLLQCENKDLIKASLMTMISWNNNDCKWDEGKYKYLKKNQQYINCVLQQNEHKKVDIQEIIENTNNSLTNYCSVINNIKQYKSVENEWQK